ncbi:HlyD family type I secretion periplasmic adaptor subunit [Pseudomonas sp. KNUC1026]|uniref:HlyD family type I secretion periplasmic adaptor subunit n=1 Tax=Pseudomonas sp. KNUC1026 TaxID=2893890 RepID=UPI001F1C9BF9|nr:HlyD family type I secretion periplasmic adaptor subunit [Pseudomonas sp. KNUC1026]UFH49383.1 HlyD family type I secretion periplasmic adaptor subunit [Pseudomonas sp. KNUC1026]
MNRRQRFRALMARYREAWQQAWAQRVQMAGPNLQRAELEFQPAALALRDTPAHPAPRLALRVLLALIALALLWAVFGKVDVVATAAGKVVQGGNSKLIQPSEAGVVSAIHVRDGQTVQAGDILLTLDAGDAHADVTRLNSEWLAAQVDYARASALLLAADNHLPPPPVQVDGIPAEQRAGAERWVQSQYHEWRRAVDKAQADIDQRQAQLKAVQASLAALARSLPIAQQLAADDQRLHSERYVPQHALLEKQQALIEQEREQQAQQARQQELRAAHRQAGTHLAWLNAQTRRQWLELQQQSAVQRTTLHSQLQKAQRRLRLTQLRAPVTGTVQQLAVHTTGGVVTQAQPLMVIVPDNAPLEIEARLQNKDIGFVHAGQAAKVKVETFLFTKYGLLGGTVRTVSRDAIADEHGALHYSMRVALARDALMVEGVERKLSPGMAVQVEVKTGRRTVMDYLLSPLKVVVSESLGER